MVIFLKKNIFNQNYINCIPGKFKRFSTFLLSRTTVATKVKYIVCYLNNQIKNKLPGFLFYLIAYDEIA